jgi:hypothetical protein
MSLLASQVDVHAIEPAHAMRTPLMTRLASLPAELRARVTVHPTTLGEAGLRRVADLAICHTMIACLSPSARHVLWPALATRPWYRVAHYSFSFRRQACFPAR